MIVKIYTTKTADEIRFGKPARHTLDVPNCSTAWYDAADYILPAGYHTAESNGCTTEVYDAQNRQCPLSDSDCFGNNGGAPYIIDIHAANRFIALKKYEEEK